MDCVEKPVDALILADQPEAYHEALAGVGMHPRCYADIHELLASLPALTYSGLILDIPTVMRAPRDARDRLFKLSESLPIMRARIGKPGGRVQFLDDIDVFIHNCKTVCPSRVRSVRRYPTKLSTLISREDDPDMTKAVPANILNISERGCYVYTLGDFSDAEFIFLKIMELEDATPIFGLIRWRKPWGETNMLPGLGVAFLDIRDAQVAEIESERHFIRDPLDGCPNSSEE
jgi:Tfp pilus assembly protein PilZ